MEVKKVISCDCIKLLFGRLRQSRVCPFGNILTSFVMVVPKNDMARWAIIRVSQRWVDLTNLLIKGFFHG